MARVAAAWAGAARSARSAEASAEGGGQVGAGAKAEVSEERAVQSNDRLRLHGGDQLLTVATVATGAEKAGSRAVTARQQQQLATLFAARCERKRTGRRHGVSHVGLMTTGVHVVLKARHRHMGRGRGHGRVATVGALITVLCVHHCSPDFRALIRF